MLPCIVNFRPYPRHPSRPGKDRSSSPNSVFPPRALGSLFSLLAARASHNSFSFIDFRTLSKNSRVSPKYQVQFLKFYLKESAVTYPLSFHVLAHSFAPAKKPTPLFPNNCALFAKNHPGWGYPHLSPRLERNSLIANIDSFFGFPRRFLSTGYASRVRGHTSAGCRLPLRMLRFGVL